MSGKITPRGSFILVKKELRLLFKTRRRIFLLVIIPLIIVISSVISGFAVRSESNDVVPVTTISVLDQNSTQITESLKADLMSIQNTKVINVSGDYSGIIDSQNFNVLVFIPANFSSLIMAQETAQLVIAYNANSSRNKAIAFEVYLDALNYEFNLIHEQNPDVNFNLVAESLEEVIIEGQEPEELTDELIGQLLILPVYIIFFVVISPMSLILISVTIEREQNTLEMLFLQPVKRQDIVLGKIYYGLTLILLTLILNLTALVIGGLLFLIISKSEFSEIQDLLMDAYSSIGLLPILGFVIALLTIAVNVIALAVMLSLLAKDEREANMISGIFPMLIFSTVIFILVIPFDEFGALGQTVSVSIPILGVVIAIYLTGIAGAIGWVAYVAVTAQILWAYTIITLITKISEAESIIELSYGKAFREIKRIILRR